MDSDGTLFFIKQTLHFIIVSSSTQIQIIGFVVTVRHTSEQLCEVTTTFFQKGKNFQFLPSSYFLWADHHHTRLSFLLSPELTRQVWLSIIFWFAAITCSLTKCFTWELAFKASFWKENHSSRWLFNFSDIFNRPDWTFQGEFINILTRWKKEINYMLSEFILTLNWRFCQFPAFTFKIFQIKKDKSLMCPILFAFGMAILCKISKTG